VAVDSEGNVYVADANNDEIRKITPSGVVTTLAGSAGREGSSDGTGSAARFDWPAAVTVDSAGNVYVADLANDEIRKITPSGVVTTLAGSAGRQGSSDGTGSAARFCTPMGVAVDSAGNVYVADDNNDEIRKVTPSGVVTTLAGSAGQQGLRDGTGSAARFYDPAGVTVDSAGNVYVADWGSCEIRKITPSGVVTTLASGAAGFNRPSGVAVDSAGNLYVGDSGNNEVREITPSGVVTTLAGTAGQSGARNGIASAATFSNPAGVVVDSAGNVYVADDNNDEIREISGLGLVSGDSAAFSETFDTRNVGTGKTLTVGGSVNDGNGGSDYSVTFVNSIAGSITALAITVTAGAATKAYDGTTSSTITPTITGSSLATGDTAAFTE
jgi:streptogramin lyase